MVYEPVANGSEYALVDPKILENDGIGAGLRAELNEPAARMMNDIDGSGAGASADPAPVVE